MCTKHLYNDSSGRIQTQVCSFGLFPFLSLLCSLLLWYFFVLLCFFAVEPFALLIKLMEYNLKTQRTMKQQQQQKSFTVAKSNLKYLIKMFLGQYMASACCLQYYILNFSNWSLITPVQFCKCISS